MGNPVASEPIYGRRLIPSLIDEKALSAPNETYCYLAQTPRIEDGFRKVSYRTFANAINACAWWIEATIGKGKDFATLAYLGPSDLRNTIAIIAAIKTGHKALLSSPRNSLKAHLNLLENTTCRILVTAEPVSQAAKDILAHRSMRHVIIPEVETWLDGPVVDSYPYIRSFDQARYEPFVVVHTSGSTGLPKVVIVNHGTIAAGDAFNAAMTESEDPLMVLSAIRNQRCFVSMPSFHIAGIDFMLPKAVFFGVVPIVGASGVPMTAEFADAVHREPIVETSILTPSILQDIAASPSYLRNLRNLNATMYGGGPLPSNAGDAVASHTRLFNMMGCSEAINIPTEVVDRQDWEYLKFSRKLGYEMRQHSEDLFELCFLREPQLDLFQGIFSTFPDRYEYSTSDLYSRHPIKPDLWKYKGRADDIITLTNGEKVNPVGMESFIGTHPGVKSVLVVGQARFQTALLVEAREPPQSDVSKQNLLSNIWPTVKEANEQCDAHARVSRDLILFTSPDKPFCRAGKGTVQRKMTQDSYSDEVERAYGSFEIFAKPHEPDEVVGVCPLDSSGFVDQTRWQSSDFAMWLRNIICNVTGWVQLDIDTNFFSLGFDSLQVINVVRAVNMAIARAPAPLLMASPKLVYANPSTNMLTKALLISKESGTRCQAETDLATPSIRSEIQRLVVKFSWDLPISSRPPIRHNPSDGKYVLLTGSTGSVGSYILGNLLESSDVLHVCCLNRGHDAENRQRTSNLARGIVAKWPTNRVSFYQSDLSQEYLGLEPRIYRSLLRQVSHVIHNAWEVNFNLPLTSFETPHLLGVRQYVDFSARSAKGASTLFLSSVSSSMNLVESIGERIIDDPSAPLPMGYAQSKHIAERVLGRASRIAGIPATICRVGQVAGPVNIQGEGGCWNKQEWLPSLIASSKHLGKLPESLGPNDVIDWIPVDVLSKVLVELMDSIGVARFAESANGDSQSLNGSRAEAIGSHDSLNTVGHQTPLSTRDNSNGSHRTDDHCHELFSPAVYHAVNPHHTTWSELLPAIEEYFSGTPLQRVSLRDWLDALHDSIPHVEDININPAVRLIEFYESLSTNSGRAKAAFETRATIGQSKELADLKAVKPEWMTLWLKQWSF